ncbi:DNA cytosine methyltransferase [bacterium]|nr:DNA cytosine methyltransferase [bacterium]
MRAIIDSLRTLSTDVLQEISDKLWVLGRRIHSDGKGLSGGMMMENTIFEIMEKHLDGFRRNNEKQSDCLVAGTKVSFKKITGKSSIALNWSKNPGGAGGIRFDCPVLIMNLEEGSWWKSKRGFDRFLNAGFYLVDPVFCNENVRLKSNNKTDSLVDSEDLYRMLTRSLEEDMFVALPPAATHRYDYTFNGGFKKKTSGLQWPRLEHEDGRPRFIDLFCGVGGFHYALSSLGGRCVFAADIDDRCRENYHLNFGVMPERDIRTVREEDIPPFDVLCAGFPCQPFSKAGDQTGFTDQTKGNLFFEIVRILRHHTPRAIFLENVKNIVTHDKGKTFQIIKEELQKIGYRIHDRPIVLSPLQFGIPQYRERAFIVGRYGADLPDFVAPPIHPTDIRSILSPYQGESALIPKHHESGLIWERFCALLLENNITIPRFPIWTDDWDRECDKEHYEKYKNWIDKNRAFYERHRSILGPWLEEARRNEKWIGCMRKLEWQCNETSLRNCLWTFRGSGIRVRGLEYSPTLVAMSMIPVYGPEWRYLTRREVCRLQDFPDSYHYDEHECYKQMGNAVNVRVVRHIGEWLFSMLR